MLDEFLRKNFKIIRISGIAIQTAITLFYLARSGHGMGKSLILLVIAIAAFFAGIIVTSVLLGLYNIMPGISRKVFVTTCNIFTISFLAGYIMFIFEFWSGDGMIAVIGTSAAAGGFLTSIFIKNRF